MTRVMRLRPLAVLVLAIAAVLTLNVSLAQAQVRSAGNYQYSDFASEDASTARAAMRRESSDNPNLATVPAKKSFAGASAGFAESSRQATRPARTLVAQVDKLPAPAEPQLADMPVGQGPPVPPPPVAGVSPPQEFHPAGSNFAATTCGNGACCGSSCTAGPCGEGLFAVSDGDWHFGMRPGQWYLGADYLAAQVHMSKADAFVRTQTTFDAARNVTAVNDVVNFEFDRESSVRAFVGYHLCGCDADLQFTYSHLEGTASLTGTATADTTISGHGGLAALAAGDTLAAHTNVDVNIYDITFRKKMMPSCQADCCCPTWDFSWFGGIRTADVSRHFFEEEQFGFFRNFDVNNQFTGAGPMVGMEARRYMMQGTLSTYFKGDIATLLGDYQHRSRREAPNGLIDTIEFQNFSEARIVPVIDLEIGASWKPDCHWTFEGGWLLQTWFDLGMSETNILAGAPVAEPLNNSSILGFDGLFARVQYAF